MAKAKATAPVESVNPFAPVPIKVQGLIFSYTPRYTEGSVLNAEEASVLNQTLGENLRNNFASKVRDLNEKIAAEAAAAGEPPRSLTEDEIAAFRADFDAYQASYIFKAPRQGAGPTDPVESEMKKIAKQMVMAALAKKNIKSTSLPEGKMESLVAEVMAKRPEVREEAVRRVEAFKGSAADALDIEI